MKMKDLYRMINEEISGFDFLNSKIQEEEHEIINTLSDVNFQKQFIIDSITNLPNKIKLKDTGDMSITSPDMNIHDEQDKISLSYDLSLSYQYNNKNIDLELSFIGDNITIHYSGWSEPGDRDTPPSSDMWISYFPWEDIEVMLFSKGGDSIPFKGLEKANDKTRELFIRAYLENMIENNLEGVEIKDNKPKYTSY